MKVFVAGATGVIGQSLLPRLIDQGHTVVAMTRRRDKAAQLGSLGVEPVVCDVFDPANLEAELTRAQPEVVIHQLTSLPRAIDPRKIEQQLAATDRIRVEGTRNLVQAAVRSGARRIVAQSISFAYAPVGGPIKSEEAPLWSDAPWPWRRTVEAVAELERQVTSAAGIDGVVLRYGYFYGPGTAFALDGSAAALVRGRKLPIAGRGSGMFSFVHVDDAADATVLALEHGEPGIYNIVDDEPSPMREWLPVYSQVLGAPRPRRMLSLLVRLLAGRYGFHYMTAQRGASNAKAKRELGWSPSHTTWRKGFAEALRREAERPSLLGGQPCPR